MLADFQNISSSTTYGQIVNFLENDLSGEGQELQGLSLPDFNASPPFLNNVTAPLPKAFAQVVHGFWAQLIRSTNATTLCGSSGNCESSLIPLNHTFVVPGSCIDCSALTKWQIDDDNQVEGSEKYITGTVSGLLKALFNLSCSQSRMQLFKTLWTNWTNLVLSLMEAVSIVRSSFTIITLFSQMKWSWVDLNRSQPPMFIQVCRHFQVSPSKHNSSRCYHFTFKQAETGAFLPAHCPLQRSESYPNLYRRYAQIFLFTCLERVAMVEYRAIRSSEESFLKPNVHRVSLCCQQQCTSPWIVLDR